MHLLKRFAVTIAGAALLLVGLAMMVLPGPGILLIVAGLAVLATEYVWARTLLVRAKKEATKVQEAAVASKTRTAGSLLFAVALIGVGIAMLIVDSVGVDLVDRFWGPVTGSIIIVTGLILVTTTVLTLKMANGQETTHVPAASAGGSSVYRAAR